MNPRSTDGPPGAPTTHEKEAEGPLGNQGVSYEESPLWSDVNDPKLGELPEIDEALNRIEHRRSGT